MSGGAFGHIGLSLQNLYFAGLYLWEFVSMAVVLGEQEEGSKFAGLGFQVRQAMVQDTLWMLYICKTWQKELENVHGECSPDDTSPECLASIRLINTYTLGEAWDRFERAWSDKIPATDAYESARKHFETRQPLTSEHIEKLRVFLSTNHDYSHLLALENFL